MNAKKNNIIRRFELVVATLLCSTALVACGTEGQIEDSVSFDSNYGTREIAIQTAETVDITDVDELSVLEVHDLRGDADSAENIDLGMVFLGRRPARPRVELGVFSFAQPMVDGQFNVVLRMLRGN